MPYLTVAFDKYGFCLAGNNPYYMIDQSIKKEEVNPNTPQEYHTTT